MLCSGFSKYEIKNSGWGKPCLFLLLFAQCQCLRLQRLIDWLIIHEAVYFNWKIAGALSRYLQISELTFKLRPINFLTESNTTRWKQKACIKCFRKEGIVLFSMQEFCDDFCSARFCLYFLAGSREPSRFNFFDRRYLSSDRSKQRFRQKSFLMLGRTGNTTNGTYKCGAMIDWLIDEGNNRILRFLVRKE